MSIHAYYYTESTLLFFSNQSADIYVFVYEVLVRELARIQWSFKIVLYRNEDSEDGAAALR